MKIKGHCGYHGMNLVVNTNEPEEALTEKGWVRVYGAGTHFRTGSMFRILFPQCKDDLRGTQAQLDTLFELREATAEAGEDTSMLDDAIRDWVVEERQ